MALSKKISLIVIILGIVFLFGFKGVYPAKAADVPRPETYFCKDGAIKSSLPSGVSVSITDVKLGEKSDTNFYPVTITWKITGTDAFKTDKYNGQYNYIPGNLSRNTGKNSSSGAVEVSKTQNSVKDAIQLDPNSTLTYQFEKFKICWRETTTLIGIDGEPRSSVIHHYAEIASSPVVVKIDQYGTPRKPTDKDGNPIDGSAPAGSADGGVSGYQACIADLSKDCSTDECCGSLQNTYLGSVSLPTMVYVQCWALCSLDQAVTKFLTFAFEAIINDALGI